MNNNELYKEFKTDEEADNWTKENYGEWIEQLKRDEYTCVSNDIADLLYCYTGNMNLIFNRLLRGYLDSELDEEELNDFMCKINIIDDAISNFKLKENIVVWRYTDRRHLERLFENNKIKVGKTFTEKSFMSTTLISKNLEDFALYHNYNTLLKIYLPKGTKGAYVYFENDGLNEKEFLLPKNCTLRLKKKKRKLFKFTKYIYECELIEQ